MSSPDVLYVWRWLIRDTFRQSIANGVFWLMLGASAVVIFFCLGISIDGGAPLMPHDDIEIRRPHGSIGLLFGAWRLPLFRDGQAQVHFLLLLLAEWVAGAGGILMALVWTAGFMPEFLLPVNATVLLAKPTPRWVLLLGKSLGVLAFVAFHATVFIGGTWLTLGLGTGFWVNSYLWSIPILLLHFAAIYSFSVLLAVWFRSVLACAFGSILFWFLCWGMNYGRHYFVALKPSLPQASPFLTGLVETGYWMLPKPVDLGMILHQALEARESFQSLPELAKVIELDAFHPLLAVLSSLAFAIVMIVIAAWQLGDTDY